MTHPKTAWKFKAWTEAMLRNAQVDTPDYGKKSGTASFHVKPRRHRRRRKRKKNAKKE